MRVKGWIISNMRNEEEIQADPEQIEKLLRCDLCNKLECICKPITNPIGFNLHE